MRRCRAIRAAQLKLASEFFFGTDARPRNPVLAVYWYRRAAELGSAEGAYNLGVCYEKGWGVEHPSLVRAGRCFDEAAKGGLPEARLRKALLMISGIPDEAEEKETLPGTPADPAARCGFCATWPEPAIFRRSGSSGG